MISRSDLHIGKQLKRAQTLAGVGNAELARRINRSRQQVWNMQRNEDMSVKTLLRVCEGLEIDVTEFLK